MRLFIHALAIVLALISTAPASAFSAGQLPKRLNQLITLDRIDQGLFDEAVMIYSNEARRQNGRKPLKSDRRLARVAADHAQNMARLQTHSHTLPVRNQRNLVERMDRMSVRYRRAGENIAMDKVYRLLGRPISVQSVGCSFVYGDTRQPVPIHTYASLAEQVVQRWMTSPRHRASLLSPAFRRMGSGVGVDPGGAACGDFYLAQEFTD